MIEFSQNERKIFDIIKEYALSSNPTITPRLAGGFVRDKIMNLSSSDIDVALDNISGYDFCLGLSQNSSISSTPHKIQANPDKSKHLETAVLNIFGNDIDFVHLRKETYTSTRVPTIETGTPKEDAMRRDITINSLFYNLITEEIEDFTGLGLKHICERKICTPLDPEITLLEDPLRILRIFRFKAKFGFEIDPKIKLALKNHKIFDALKDKVSNERIGIEIRKMLEYENSKLGIMEIVENNYFEPIFKPITSKAIDSKKVSDYLEFIEEIIIKIKEIAKKYNLNIKHIKFDRLNSSKELFQAKTLFIDYSMLKLFSLLQFHLCNKIYVRKSIEYENVIMIKDGLKFSKDIFNKIKRIEMNSEFISNGNKLDFAELILDFGDLWIESMIIAAYLNRRFDAIKYIEEIFLNGLEKCYIEPRLINGNDLSNYNLDRKDYSKYLKICQIYQIKNKINNKEEMEKYLQSLFK